jgi:hypothetical protein
MTFVEPWRPVEKEKSEQFVAELRREMCPGHALYGLAVSTVAQRDDRDDFLFSLDDGSSRIAVVHLTFQKETSPEWPSTVIWPNVEAWACDLGAGMLGNHEEWKEWQKA